MTELQKRISKARKALSRMPAWLSVGSGTNPCVTCHGSRQVHGKSWEPKYIDCPTCAGKPQ